MEVLTKPKVTNFFIDDTEIAKDVDTALDEIKDVRADLSLQVNGDTIELSHKSSRMLINILEALSAGSRITIETTPKEVSASTAADMLGVSRPTFLKLAKEQDIKTIKVNTQKRFLTQDVIALRSVQRKKKIKAFEKLRAELDELGEE